MEYTYHSSLSTNSDIHSGVITYQLLFSLITCHVILFFECQGIWDCFVDIGMLPYADSGFCYSPLENTDDLF